MSKYRAMMTRISPKGCLPAGIGRFTYFYRILDKYGKPATAIAIFTDSNKKFKPSLYEYDYLGTKNTFQFNTYKIVEQEEKALEESKNPFATLILIVLLALKSGKLVDNELFKLKFSLAKKLLEQKFPKQKIRGLMNFLKFYIHFADPKYNLNFDKTIEQITENNRTMGIEEMILERVKKEGLEKGRLKGLEEGLEKGILKGKAEVVSNLLLKMAMTDAQAADIAGVPVDFVKKVRRKLKK